MLLVGTAIATNNWANLSYVLEMLTWDTVIAHLLSLQFLLWHLHLQSTHGNRCLLMALLHHDDPLRVLYHAFPCLQQWLWKRRRTSAFSLGKRSQHWPNHVFSCLKFECTLMFLHASLCFFHDIHSVLSCFIIHILLFLVF